MYGAQAAVINNNTIPLFENDVEMYGAQACKHTPTIKTMFENDVEMYGAQANEQIRKAKISQGIS